MEEAKLLWAQGQQPMALRLAQSLLNELGVQGVLPTLQSELAVVNAKWLAQSRHVLCFSQDLAAVESQAEAAQDVQLLQGNSQHP